MSELLAFLTVASATTLGASEVMCRWSPAALRFKWSAGWTLARWIGISSAVILSAHMLL